MVRMRAAALLVTFVGFHQRGANAEDDVRFEIGIAGAKHVRDQRLETIGADGGFIMDASAIMQNDTTVENLRAMTDATLEYGVYRS